MAFNEQNTVEHFIPHLIGINLNAVQGNLVKEDSVEYERPVPPGCTN